MGVRYFRVGDPMIFVATETLCNQGSETRNMVLKRRNNLILRCSAPTGYGWIQFSTNITLLRSCLLSGKKEVWRRFMVLEMRYFRVGDPMIFVATETTYTQGSETRNMVLKGRNNMILRCSAPTGYGWLRFSTNITLLRSLNIMLLSGYKYNATL